MMLHTTPLIAEVIEATAEEFYMPVETILARDRPAQLARARMIAAYCAAHLTGRPHTEIGARMKRDSSTIFHSVHTIEELRKTNSIVDLRIELITERTMAKVRERGMDIFSKGSGDD